MRRILFKIGWLMAMAAFCCAVALADAQSYTIATKRLLHRHQRSAQAKAAEAIPVDVLITLSRRDEDLLRAKGAKIFARFGDVVTAQVPLAAIAEIAALPGVRQVAVAEMGERNTDESLLATDAFIPHQGTAYGLPKSYTGKNVVVGIIDAGIDFNHMAFMDAKGSTRIQRVYMPGNNTGKKVVLDGDTIPGSEFFASDVPRLSSDLTNYSHGTHCLAIAAGSKVGAYSGMAPNADIVVCALGYTYNFNQAAIANSARYILNYAKSVGKPCVISLSIGFQGGPHDGSSAFCQALASVVAEGAVLCSSVGNTAGFNRMMPVPPHGAEVVGSTLPNALDSVIGDVVINTWSLSSDTIGVKLLLIHPATKKVVYATPVITADKRLAAGADYIHEPDFNIRLSQYVEGEIEVLTTIGLNGKFNIQTRAELKKKPGGVHYLLAVQWSDPHRAGHNSWLLGSSFTAFTGADSEQFSAGTTDGCINDNATAAGVISVGNYAARNAVPMLAGGEYTDAATQPGNFVATSGFASCLYGEVYPTVSAPGNMVISALNTYNSDYYNAAARRLSFAAYNPATGKTNYWGQNTGTSMAAPTVAGIVALWLEANPQWSPAEVKQKLISSAISDDFVRQNPARFGNGKVNALGGFLQVKLPLCTILSSEKYGVDRYYRITDKILKVYRISADRRRLYTRSDGESFNTSLLQWMAIDLPEALSEKEAKRFVGAWLTGVEGTLADKRNPLLQASLRPDYVQQFNAPRLSVITPANYYGTQDGFYFVRPKPMEVDTLQYAMWNPDSRTFTMPWYAPMWGVECRKGSAKVDFSLYEGECPPLAPGATYKWLVLNMVDESSSYVAYPFALVGEMGQEPLWGDVNADGMLNVSDVTALINHILGIASPEPYRCDLNSDGIVNVSDATSLIHLLLQ